MKNKRGKYDVVIIGSGIGGLIAACYLINHNLSVLVVEQHDKPGGCCTSFEMNGYRFDVGVHYLGSVKRGVLSKILKELNIAKELEVNQFDPVERVVTPDSEILIRADPMETINSFKRAFPQERNNLERFFRFILSENFLKEVYVKVLQLTYQEVLDNFFSDKRIKSVLDFIAMWNIGAPARIGSALSSIVLMREYILDPGYYPRGGIQSFPQKLCEYFIQKGGELLLSTKVEEIILVDNKVRGVKLANNNNVKSRVVLANADAHQVFGKLIKDKTFERGCLASMEVCPSMFAVFMGLSINLKDILNNTANIFYISEYDITDRFFDLEEIVRTKKLKYLVAAFSSSHDVEQESPHKSTVNFYIYADYKNKSFWTKNKELLTDLMVLNGERFIPNIDSFVEAKFCANPDTFQRFTLNRRGSYAGWSPQLYKTRKQKLRQRTSIGGLYCAGHWYTGEYVLSGGVPMVSYSGRRAANLILEDIGLSWNFGEISL